MVMIVIILMMTRLNVLCACMVVGSIRNHNAVLLYIRLSKEGNIGMKVKNEDDDVKGGG